MIQAESPLSRSDPLPKGILHSIQDSEPGLDSDSIEGAWLGRHSEATSTPLHPRICHSGWEGHLNEAEIAAVQASCRGAQLDHQLD